MSQLPKSQSHSSKKKKCPNCGKLVPSYATKCKYCDTKLKVRQSSQETNIVSQAPNPEAFPIHQKPNPSPEDNASLRDRVVLTPWNPYHWFRLLSWLLVRPQNLSIHLSSQNARYPTFIYQTASWLVSSLLHLPTTLAVLWIQANIDYLRRSTDFVLIYSEEILKVWDFRWIALLILSLWFILGSLGAKGYMLDLSEENISSRADWIVILVMLVIGLVNATIAYFALLLTSNQQGSLAFLIAFVFAIFFAWTISMIIGIEFYVAGIAIILMCINVVLAEAILGGLAGLAVDILEGLLETFLGWSVVIVLLPLITLGLVIWNATHRVKRTLETGRRSSFVWMMAVGALSAYLVMLYFVRHAW
jgi:ribosomal protein L40E